MEIMRSSCVAAMAQKKQYKGGSVVGYEPTDMKLLEEDLVFSYPFAIIRCLRFFEKLQGFHGQIAKYISMNFTRTKTKVGMLNFAVSPYTISHVIQIPRSGEMWFKI